MTTVSASNIEKINQTFNEVRKVSFLEKKEASMSEESINAFLDKIIEFKKLLQEKTKKIELINENLEKITWFDDLEEEALIMINETISLCKDLHSTLIRFYVRLNFLKVKGIAKNEIKVFKSVIDDLKEISEDLESVFFFLPQMPDFKDTTKKLSLI